MADNTTTESSATSESSSETTFDKEAAKVKLEKVNKILDLGLTEEKSHYRERIKNYTIDADAKPTPSVVEAAAARIKDLKGQIKNLDKDLRVLSAMKSASQKHDDEDRSIKILKMQAEAKDRLIHLYRQLGDAVIAYNSKYSIAAQLAQTATAATEIAEALTA